MTAYDAVVLAGGEARRLAGADKALIDLGGRTALDRVLDSVADAASVVAVGPPRPGTRPGLEWCREDPPGGGPARALAAAVERLRQPSVVVLGVDCPLVTRGTVRRMLISLGSGAPTPPAACTAGAGPDAVVLVDAQGRDQPLVAAYRLEALRRSGGHRSMRSLLAGLRVLRLPDDEGVTLDCDTWADVEAVRRRLATEEGSCSTSG